MTDARQVLVIGAGPAGLAAAACLRSYGIEPDLADRHGEAGGAYARMDPAMELASPSRYDALPGLDLPAAPEYVHARGYHDYLLRYADHHRIGVRRAHIRSVARSAKGFVADDGAGPRTYDAVVVASGAFDFPRVPEIAGIESCDRVMHARDWQGARDLQGRRVLVIGGATSAVEIAEQCAAAGLATTISVRKGVHVGPRRVLGRDVHDYAFLLERLPVALGARYCAGRQALPAGDRGFRAARRAGDIEVRPEVHSFESGAAHFADGTREAFDVVVIATGYRYGTPYLPAEVARREPNGALAARDNESVSWPGLHVMGHACARGFDSQFLRGIARDAPRVAFSIRRRLERSRAH